MTMVKKKLPKAISVEKFKICNKNIEIGYVCFLRTIMVQGEKKFVLYQLREEKQEVCKMKIRTCLSAILRPFKLKTK